MSRTDAVADYLSQLRRQLPQTAPGRRRLLKESEEHLDQAVADLVADGHERHEAQRIAIRRFGPPHSLARQVGYASQPDSEPSSAPKGRGIRRAGRQRQSRNQRLGPLMVSAVTGVLLLAMLPSSLSLPQSDPSETLEYAPVPPEGDDATPPAGNLSSLSLANGRGLSSGEAAGTDTASPGGAVGGSGASPRTKRCVGNPPRQTEDRLSPPCVGFFTGDNFGATHAGVSQQEIRILIQVPYLTEHQPGTIVDLGQPPKEGESQNLRILRTWQRYFNDRYQAYGRFVRFFVLAGEAATVEAARAQASEAWNQVRPFAAISTMTTQQTVFLQELARRGVVSFTANNRALQSDYAKYPGLLWGFDPSVDRYTALAADYICRKLVRHPVSYSGNPTDMGKPRRLGLYHTSDTNSPNVVLTWQLVRRSVEQCGGVWADEQTYPGERAVGEDTNNTDPNGARTSAIARAMASFRQSGVTTIIWSGGLDVATTQQAAAQQYRPEWLQVGVGGTEGNLYSKLQNQSVWRHALLYSDVVREDRPQHSACYQAYHSTAGDDSFQTDSEGGFTDVAWACLRTATVYPNLVQMFTGVQVSGPRLNPRNLERGFRAIPKIASDEPFVPACFYEPGDYTCVKDGVVEWWDPAGTNPNSAEAGSSGSAPGCWRMTAEGRRYIKGGWPAGDHMSDRRAGADPCNNLES